MKLVLLCCALLNTTVFATTLSWKTVGGDLFSPVSESLSLSDSGEVIYETRTPFPQSRLTPNRIGRYVTKVPPSTYRDTLDSIASANKLSRLATTFPHSALTDQLSLPGTAPMFFDHGNDAVPLRHLRGTFEALRERALGFPERVLELNCSRNNQRINCSLTNMGSAALITPNPLAPGNALFCLSRSQYLSEIADTAADPAAPHQLELGAKASFSFSFSASPACSYRIVSRTAPPTRLSTSPSSHVSGELISNSL